MLNYRDYNLNQTAVRVELARRNKNLAWLGAQLGITRQGANTMYWRKSTKHVDKISEIFGIHQLKLLEPKE